MARKINEAGLVLVKRFEGFSSKPYFCSAGYLTIGWGHVVAKGQNFTEITTEEAENFLKMDINKAESSVYRLIKVALTDNQYAALVSFAFNLGGGALQRSTLRSRLNRFEYQGASEEFTKWCFAGGVKSKGLLRRRFAEKDLFLT